MVSCDEVPAPKERHGAERSALLRARDTKLVHLGLERRPFHAKRRGGAGGPPTTAFSLALAL